MTIDVKIKTEIPFYLLALPLLWAFGIITNDIPIQSFPILLITLLMIVSYLALIFRYNMVSLDIQNKQIILQKVNLLGFSKTGTKPLDLIQFSYRTEKQGFRGPIVNVCKLYINERKIAEFVADQDGWTELNVAELAKNLALSGIERQTEKFSDREIEINGL